MARHDDQRRSRRFDWEKRGLIRLPNRPDEVCVIRDISQHGARIAVTGELPVPDAFDLLIRQGAPPRGCKVVWRSSSEVGVEFRPQDRVRLDC